MPRAQRSDRRALDREKNASRRRRRPTRLIGETLERRDLLSVSLSKPFALLGQSVTLKAKRESKKGSELFNGFWRRLSWSAARADRQVELQFGR